MKSVPTIKSSLTYDFTAMGEQEPPEGTGVNLSSIICVLATWLELIPEWFVVLVYL